MPPRSGGGCLAWQEAASLLHTLTFAFLLGHLSRGVGPLHVGGQATHIAFVQRITDPLVMAPKAIHGWPGRPTLAFLSILSPVLFPAFPLWVPSLTSSGSCSSLKLSGSKHHLFQEALPHTQVGLQAPPECSCCPKDLCPRSRHSTRCVPRLSPPLSCEFSEGIDHVPFIYSFSKFLLNTSYVTGTVLGAADAAVTRQVRPHSLGNCVRNEVLKWISWSSPKMK